MTEIQGTWARADGWRIDILKKDGRFYGYVLEPSGALHSVISGSDTLEEAQSVALSVLREVDNGVKVTL